MTRPDLGDQVFGLRCAHLRPAFCGPIEQYAPDRGRRGCDGRCCRDGENSRKSDEGPTHIARIGTAPDSRSPSNEGLPASQLPGEGAAADHALGPGADALA